MSSNVFLSKTSRATRPLRNAVRFSSALFQAELTARSRINAANNYAWNLIRLNRHKEGKTLLRKMLPVARRVLGEGHQLTLLMRRNCAVVLYEDPAATLDNLRQAVTTLEDIEPIARRVLGPAHPVARGIEHDLKKSRAALARATLAK